MDRSFRTSCRSLLIAFGLYLAVLGLAAAPVCATPVFTSLYSFSALSSGNNGDGANPQYGALCQGRNGIFYGTTSNGGSSGRGTVFQIAPTGAEKTLVTFTGANGAYPTSLALGSDGNLYGTTSQGGSSFTGTVFQMTPSGTMTTIYDFSAYDANFDNGDGAAPYGTLTLGSDGNLYGTTYDGGVHGSGTVFKITNAGVLTTLYAFSALPSGYPFVNSDGARPYGALIQGTDGSFYGTTSQGGMGGNGAVFKITSSGSFTAIYSFTANAGGANPNGSGPAAGLVQGRDGNFYGTTYYGGAHGGGTVFKITTAGTLTTLIAFDNATLPNQGIDPSGALILGPDGNFYGTTTYGGSSTNGSGTVFKMTPSGTLTTLYRFSPASGNAVYPVNSDGAEPTATLTLGSDGNLYGTTFTGGPNGTGTLFRVEAQSRILYSFSALSPGSPSTNADGARPASLCLLQANDGDFYGTTNQGGAAGDGTIFKTDSGGAFTVLHTFSALSNGSSGTNSDGGDAIAGLTQGRDGNFYGATALGGPSGSGTIYQLTPSGTLTTLLNFTGPNGFAPLGCLVQGSDGSFYGTTYQGGASGSGTVFKIASSGVLTTLYSFSVLTATMPYTNPDGAGPFGGLIVGGDGNLYGTTKVGGPAGNGTVFKITPAGALTTLHPFSALSNGMTGTNPDGAQPYDGLSVGNDGNFYGTASAGGSVGNGVVFKITSAGAFTVLHPFSTTLNRANADGAIPNGTVVQGDDGNFYGTTGRGGALGLGTVFRMTPDGMVTPLINGNSGIGAFFLSRLTAGSDGNLYGTAEAGGANATGLLYRVDGPPVGTPASVATIGTSPVPLMLTVTDPSGIGIDSVAFPAAPAHGTVTVGAITETGTTGTIGLTYTPAAGFSGPDSFTYTVTGYTGTSAPQTVTIMVQPPVPVITSFTPTSGPVGTNVVLTGSHFTGAAFVKFNGTSASFSVTSDTRITTTVPSGATTGAITVGNASGTASSATFTVTSPVPTITGFTPNSGPAGTTVVITGTNLTGTTVVGFQGKHATNFTVNSQGTQITTTVPTGAVTGPVAVATPSGTAHSSMSFTVIAAAQPPTITGFTPSSGPVGTMVTITGTNLTGTTVVGFQGKHATSFTVVSATTITTTVPAGAVTGPVAVATPSGTAHSGTSFTVTP